MADNLDNRMDLLGARMAKLEAATALQGRIEVALRDVDLGGGAESGTYERLSFAALHAVAPVLAERDAELQRATDLVAELRKHVDSLAKVNELQRAELARKTADYREAAEDASCMQIRLDEAKRERDELRAHGVARDIGQANDELRAELEALKAAASQTVRRMARRTSEIRHDGRHWYMEWYKFSNFLRYATDDMVRSYREAVRVAVFGHEPLPDPEKWWPRPDTEATTESAERAAVSRRVTFVDDAGREQAFTVDQIVDAVEHGDKGPATPAEPRVWRMGDPEPPESIQVLVDCKDDHLPFLCRIPGSRGWWQWFERPADWHRAPGGVPWAEATAVMGSGAKDYVVALPEMTEVVETTPSGIPDSISTSGNSLASGTSGDSRDGDER